MNRTTPRMNFDPSRRLGPHHYSKIPLTKTDKQKMTSLFGQDAKQQRRRRSTSCGCWGRGGPAPPGNGRSGGANSGFVDVDGDFYYRPSVEAISQRYREANYSGKGPSDRRFDFLPDSTNMSSMASKPQLFDPKAIVKPSGERKTLRNSDETQFPATAVSPVSKTRNSQMEKTQKAIWEAERRDETKKDEMFFLASSRKEINHFMANENFDEEATEARKRAFLTENLKKIGTDTTIPLNKSAENSTQKRPTCLEVRPSKANRFNDIDVKYAAFSKRGYDNSSYTSRGFDEVPEDHGHNEELDSSEFDSDDSVFISNSEPIYEDMDRSTDEQMSRGLRSIQLNEFSSRLESKVNRFGHLNEFSFIPPPPEFR